MTPRDLIKDLVMELDMDGGVFVRIEHDGKVEFCPVLGIAQDRDSYEPRKGLIQTTLIIERG
jgi:hypothetical protein